MKTSDLLKIMTGEDWVMSDSKWKSLNKNTKFKVEILTSQKERRISVFVGTVTGSIVVENGHDVDFAYYGIKDLKVGMCCELHELKERMENVASQTH